MSTFCVEGFERHVPGRIYDSVDVDAAFVKCLGRLFEVETRRSSIEAKVT